MKEDRAKGGQENLDDDASQSGLLLLTLMIMMTYLRYERRRSHVLREKKRHGEIEIFVLYLECFEFMLEA